jgi:hypothetical protein
VPIIDCIQEKEDTQRLGHILGLMKSSQAKASPFTSSVYRQQQNDLNKEPYTG